MTRKVSSVVVQIMLKYLAKQNIKVSLDSFMKTGKMEGVSDSER